MPMNKKGDAGIGIGALVTIILVVLVLVGVGLWWGFGFGNTTKRIGDLFHPASSVGNVQEACKYSGTINDKFDYCCKVRRVKITDDADPILTTCSGTSQLNLFPSIGCSDADCVLTICDIKNIKLEKECGEADKNKILKPGRIPIEEGKVCCIKLKSP